MFEVAQGLILGSHLFKIFEADLFFILSNIDISNFADDNTPYISGNNVDYVIESPEEALFSISDCNGTRTHNHLVRKRTLNPCSNGSSIIF